MKVTVCIASRGKADGLVEKVEEILAACTLPDTRVSIAFDEDDEAGIVHFDNPRVVWSVAARADDLGSAFNRCARQCPADLYVCGDDDRSYGPIGWDSLAAEAASKLPAGIGMVAEERADKNALPDFLAVTEKMASVLGYLMPTHFPFWFIDTWLDEVARMAGCMVRAPITVSMRPEGTRGMRDLAWWAEFFDRTRPLRHAEASDLLDEITGGTAPPSAIWSAVMQHDGMLLARNANLRNSATAASIEARGYDAVADERYKRTRQRAEELLLREVL